MKLILKSRGFQLYGQTVYVNGTKNENFNELIGGSNKYIVPRFQRDYAWDVEQWEDLWSDVTALDDEGFHYMGYIVLQQKNSINMRSLTVNND